MKSKYLAVVILLLLVGTSTIPAIAKNVEKISQEKNLDRTGTQQPTNKLQGDIQLSLWVGVISDVKHQGGWTPTICFHAISVIVLLNYPPWRIWYRNTDIEIPEDRYIGRIGKSTICALVEY
jgi:hypothetical protein